MLPLLAEINWPEILTALGVGGAVTALIQGFFTRRKEKDDKEKVTFETLLIAIKERLEKAETKIIDLENQLNLSEKEVLKLTVTITEQQGKIALYEAKIAEYETRLALYDVTQKLKAKE